MSSRFQNTAVSNRIDEGSQEVSLRMTNHRVRAAFADLFPRAKGSLEDAKVPFAVPFFMKHRRDCNTQQKHNHPQAARRAPKLTGARVSMKAKFGRGSLNLNATQFGPKTKKSLRASVWARTRRGGKKPHNPTPVVVVNVKSSNRGGGTRRRHSDAL